MKGQRSPSSSSLRWILLCLSCCLSIRGSTAGTVFLNGPQIQESDLRSIDSYVSQGLPIYPGGFQLYSGSPGSRPIIIKMANPDGVKKEMPNPGYYTNLPAVIPRGFEGVASTSFFLGPPLSSSSYVEQNQEQQQQQQQGPQIIAYENAQPSIRVENSVQLGGVSNGNGNELVQNQGQFGGVQARSNVAPGPVPVPVQAPDVNAFIQRAQPRAQLLTTNPVVVETSKFENSLPSQFRNPFYSNENIASSLAQQSLPAEGEEVVSDSWNTNKIQNGKIRDLLSGAGLI